MTIPTEAWIVISALIGGLVGGGFSYWITRLNLAHERGRIKDQQRHFYHELNHKRRVDFVEKSCFHSTKATIAANGIVQPDGEPQQRAIKEFEESFQNIYHEIPFAHLYLAQDELETHHALVNALGKFRGNRDAESLKEIQEGLVKLTCTYKIILGVEESVPATLETLYPEGREGLARTLEQRYGTHGEERKNDVSK